MTVIVAGTVSVPPQNIETFRPRMRAMIEASRAEAGCLDYAYAEDVLEPGLVRVFEVWRDEASLRTHFATEHMKSWRAVWPSVGVTDRQLTLYTSSGDRPL